jgi:hypothetical protein
MYAFDRICRALAASLLAVAVVVATAGAGPAFAQSKSAKPKHDATALPEPLTHDSIRELVSRLPDEDVRKLLISQLDRAAVPAKAKDGAMSGMVEQNAGMVRERLREIKDAFLAFPTTLREVVAKLDEPDGPSVLGIVLALIVGMLLIAWLAERIYHRAPSQLPQAARAPRSRNRFLRARSGSAWASCSISSGILVFALAALGIFLALWQGHGLRRIAIIEILIGVVLVRVTALFARFLLSKRNGTERLLPFADKPAAQLRWFAILRRDDVGRRPFRPGHSHRRRRGSRGARPRAVVHVVPGFCHRGVDGLAGAHADRSPDSRRQAAQHHRRLARRPVARDRHRFSSRRSLRPRVFDILSGTPGRRGAGSPERAACRRAADRRPSVVPGGWRPPRRSLRLHRAPVLVGDDYAGA